MNDTLENGLKQSHCSGRAHGGAERNRTADLLIANEALSQLSYSPMCTQGGWGKPGRLIEAGLVGGAYTQCQDAAPRADKPCRIGSQKLSPRLSQPNLCAKEPNLTALLVYLISLAVSVYSMIILATVIMSWLIGLNIVNGYRPEVRAVQRVLYRLTEPLLGPIRKRIPPISGFDLSPLILLFAVQFAGTILVKLLQEAWI